MILQKEVTLTIYYKTKLIISYKVQTKKISYKTKLKISYKLQTRKEIKFGILQMKGREKYLKLVIDTWLLTANLVKKLIYSSAELSYLSSSAGERFNISHLYHA